MIFKRQSASASSPRNWKWYAKLCAKIFGVLIVLSVLFFNSNSVSNEKYEELNKKYKSTVSQLKDSEDAFKKLKSEYKDYKQEAENAKKELQTFKDEEAKKKAEEEKAAAKAQEEAAAKAKAQEEEAAAKAKAQEEEAARANAQAANETNSSNGDMVWISATGSKYHSINNCGTMNPNRASQMNRSDAETKGYEACQKCY